MNRPDNQENLSYSQQNILANSIRIARQKLTKPNPNPSSKQLPQQSETPANKSISFSQNKSTSSAAQAIKTLHSRIAQLQAFNATLARQLSQAKKQNNLRGLQIQALGSELRDCQDQLVLCRENVAKLEKGIKEKHYAVVELESKLRELDLVSRKKAEQMEVRIVECVKLREHLEEKVREQNKRLDNNQKVIVQMIRQLEQQKNKNSKANTFNSPHIRPQQTQTNKHSKSSKQKQLDNFPVIVDQPDAQSSLQYKITSTSNPQPQQQKQQKKPRNPISKSPRTLQQLQQKNHQLYNMLKTCDRKFKQEQKIKNQYKDRFYCLKNVTDLLVEEINRLPAHFFYKFKCFIVKVKKVQIDNLECLKSFSLHRNRFHSRSSRNSSKSSSKNKKQKQLKMQDLNLSDHTIQSHSHSKSKRKSLSTYLKSHSGKKQTQTKMEQTEQSQTVRLLSRRIREQRKQLCEMYKRVQQERDADIVKKLKSEYEEKMAQNIELVTELENCKRLKI